MEKSFDTHKFIICHDGGSVVHYSEVAPGTNVASGQPFYEEFDDEEEWKNRLKELGVVKEVRKRSGRRIARE